MFFQNKLIDYEFKNYNQLLDLITNKIYFLKILLIIIKKIILILKIKIIMMVK
jgi:hypothetical protein